MQLLYNLLALVLVVLAAPVFLYRLVREAGFGERLKQSFGWLPAETVAKVADKNAIWLHAASVGEIVATSPMVKEIKREIPDGVVLISVVTASGYAMAKRIIPEADGVIFFPLDLPWLSRGVIKKIAPQAFLLVETELWPNFLKACRQQGIPVMMVNGRIGDKSFGNYRYLGSVLQDMLQTVVKFCMQSAVDAQYIIKLGADPQRVMVTGNTKYDQTYTDVSEEEQKQLISQYGFDGLKPVLIAGSTHKGEEESLFSSFCKIKERFPQAGMMIAPRDIQRADELASIAAACGHKAVKRSRLQGGAACGHDVVILDTIGELGRAYSVADVVFVGGSLTPQGGHNILEPAAHGKPIIVGPHMFNFKDIYALLSDRKACITAQDPELLTGKLLAVLENRELSAMMSKNARAIIEENRGAAHKNTLQLKMLLEKANNL